MLDKAFELLNILETNSENGRVATVTFSADGKWVIGGGGVGGRSAGLWLWVSETGELCSHSTLRGATDPICAIQADISGRVLAVARWFETGFSLHHFPSLKLKGRKFFAPDVEPESVVAKFAFDKRSKKLYAACWNKTVQVLNQGTNICQTMPLLHDENVDSVFPDTGVDRIISATAGSIYVSNIKSHKLEVHLPLTSRSHKIWRHVCSPNRNWLVNASENGKIRVWKTNTRDQSEANFRIDSKFIPVAVKDDGSGLLAISPIGKTFIIELPSGLLVRQSKSKPILAAAVSDDFTRLVLSHTTKDVRTVVCLYSICAT